MKKSIQILILMPLLASCSGWVIEPIPNNQPTPFQLATRTPSIYSPTPEIHGADTAIPEISTVTPMLTATLEQTATSISHTLTSTVSSPGVKIVILGCDTGVDISHGMGEVTNAYVTIINNGNVDLTTLSVTLFALDEGRIHPDKTRNIDKLPVNYQVSVKLTVDSTYKQETPIQVEVKSDQGVFPREGVGSCRDIGLFAPKADSMNTPIPGNP